MKNNVTSSNRRNAREGNMKLNTKTKKQDLINYVTEKRADYPGLDGLAKKTKKFLLGLAKEIQAQQTEVLIGDTVVEVSPEELADLEAQQAVIDDQPIPLTKAEKKAAKKAAKLVKAEAKDRKLAETKAAKAAAKKAKAKNLPAADGKRTSKPGAMQFFRDAISVSGFEINRKELVEDMIKTFGPKARWSAMNYIAAAKKGLLSKCSVTIVEEDGVLKAAS